MANIAATDFTITIEDRYIEGKKRKARVKLALSATQSLAYPTAGVGIQLPSYSKMGMIRNLDFVNIIEAPGATGAGGILWNYSVSNNAVRGYWSLNPTAAGGPTHFQELPTTWNVSETNAAGVQFYVECVGW